MAEDSKFTKVTVHSSGSALASPARLILSVFDGVWSSRELIWSLFVRDLRSQYRQSIMGYVWLFVPPVVTAAVWFFLNNQRIIRVETDIPYPIFVIVGTTIWASFISFVQRPLIGLLGGKPVFTKIEVPPEAFIFSSMLRAIFEMGLRVLILIPVFVAYKFQVPPTAFLFPLVLLLLALVGLAIGTMVIPIGGLYSAVQNGINSFIGLFMYTVPVVFPIPESGGYLATIMNHNPLTPVVALARDVLTTGSLEWAGQALITGGVSAIILFLSLLFLRVALPHLIARMGM